MNLTSGAVNRIENNRRQDDRRLKPAGDKKSEDAARCSMPFAVLTFCSAVRTRGSVRVVWIERQKKPVDEH